VKLNRTALTAAASVIAILTAGSAALAANFGILSHDDHSDALTSTPSIVATEFSADDSHSGTSPVSETVGYQVPGVGVVTLHQEGDELTVVSVDADPSWTWKLDDEQGDHQGNGDGITIRFTSDTSVVVFTAHVEDGSVVVDAVEEQPTPSTSTTTTTMDDQHQADDQIGEVGDDDAYEQEAEHSDSSQSDDHEDGHGERDDD